MDWNAISGIAGVISVIIALAPYVYASWLKIRQKSLSPQLVQVMKLWGIIVIVFGLGFFLGQSNQTKRAEFSSLPKDPLPISTWKLIYFGKFSRNDAKWYTYSWDGPKTTAKIFIEKRYRIEVQDHSNLGFGGTYEQGVFTIENQFYVEVETQKLRGGDTSGFGLMFHFNKNDNRENNFYCFEIRNDQTFSVFVIENDKEPVFFLDMPSNVIIPGEVNKLGVVGDNDKYRFYINNQYVGEILDTRLSDGFVGFWNTNEPNENVVIEFDNIRIYKP